MGMLAPPHYDVQLIVQHSAMKATNPANEQFIREYVEHTPSDTEQRLKIAEAAFVSWRQKPLTERAVLLQNAAQGLRTRQRELSALMTAEMGKPITAAEAEIEKCAGACDYFAENAARMLATQLMPSDASRSYVCFDPLGAILGIMPWNFPFWQVFRFAAPTLVAGNVVVLKHAPNVPGCALAIEALFREAGFDEGVFTTLLLPNEKVDALIAHPTICAVSLTGSERAGMAVASAAGRALKKCVLELGGSDAFIVLSDADIPRTAQAAAAARCVNSGQSCIAAKRFIVEKSVADAFEAAMVEQMSRLKIGDPMDRATEIGPLARLDLLENLHAQVTDSVAAGARLLLGGRRVSGKGYYYEPTLLGDVRPGMAAFEEETFGPVAAVIRAENAAHAVALANASRFGLGASIWTKNVESSEQMAAELEAGCVFINGIVKSDPRLPFGGVKRSGFGRELSHFGMMEFVNIKTVWVK
jgi:succinate-semialdehyde dehydrogenase/glutarate-semialdehyde dehydrogenase